MPKVNLEQINLLYKKHKPCKYAGFGIHLLLLSQCTNKSRYHYSCLRRQLLRLENFSRGSYEMLFRDNFAKRIVQGFGYCWIRRLSDARARMSDHLDSC